MARKKSLYDSKDAQSCPCLCCKWHSSRILSAILAIMFVLIIAAFAAVIIYGNNIYYSAVEGFTGVILLIVFLGLIFGFFCSCRGVHWSRHGFGMFDEALMIARKRYAKGEITKKEYDKIVDELR